MQHQGGSEPEEDPLCTSWAEAYARHKRSVWDQAVRSLRRDRDASLAFDVCQEVWAEMDVRMRAPGGLPRRVKKELELLVASTVRSMTRTRARRRLADESEADELPSSQPGPEELWVSAEDRAGERRLVDAVFEKMTPEDKQVIVMCHLDRLSYEQAAARLGCSERALAGRLRRAREEFRAIARRLTAMLDGGRRTR